MFNALQQVVAAASRSPTCYARFFTRPLSATAGSQRDESYARSVGGAGFSLNGRHALAGTPLSRVAGAETYRESTDDLFFEGTIGRRRDSAAAYDRTYDFNSVSAFGEVGAAPSPYFKPTLGVR